MLADRIKIRSAPYIISQLKNKGNLYISYFLYLFSYGVNKYMYNINNNTNLLSFKIDIISLSKKK